jgi:hypothetical protein
MISNIVLVRILLMLLVDNDPIIISRNSQLESRLLNYLCKNLTIPRKQQNLDVNSILTTQKG